MNELHILKKHLGDFQNTKSEFQTKEFCEQISDANDFIGALQVLNLSLKKLAKNIKDRSNDAENNATLDSLSSALVQNCSFMGASLFDNAFKVNVNKQDFSFEIQNPLLILENSDHKGVLAYIEDKLEEISSLLTELSQAIIAGSDLEFNLGQNDFKKQDKFY